MKPEISIFWFRRDLRLSDNAGLYHALKGKLPVLLFFILDRNILDQLQNKDDLRVSFIFEALHQLNIELASLGSSLMVKYASAQDAWEELIDHYNIQMVYTNHDQEPYAQQRDSGIAQMLAAKNITFHTFKDHTIFERDEVLKNDGKPYTVFTPYKAQWLKKLNPSYYKPYPTEKYYGNLYQTPPFRIIDIEATGFIKQENRFPSKSYTSKLPDYGQSRDFPYLDATTRMSVHLRFGTVSIRQLTANAIALSDVWLNELIWRDFYFMIIWHYPHSAEHAFKPQYDHIEWRNNENEFETWCEGRTGYPIVDAGMRELNSTGFMHNRVRMIVASFLTKHLLIDWRWGERYFAEKLLDFELASNVGGWQWAAGSGCDAAPYFRIFNPTAQQKKFDPQFIYIKKWVPEFTDPFKYPKPIVDHQFARERVLRVYKKALK